jgi:hypothetical protein
VITEDNIKVNTKFSMESDGKDWYIEIDWN